MAERKLNLNAPLMSVRRFASPKRESPRAMVEHRHSHPNDCPQVTEPVAVPFHWEQIPGRAKYEYEPPRAPPAPLTPRAPPGKLAKAMSVGPTAAERDRLELKDSEDDSYSDALETLSSRESVSLNCSASGSDFAGQLVQPSGSFSTDPQTRDFMMKRFLPAAKAMALEPHPCKSRQHTPPRLHRVLTKPSFAPAQQKKKHEEEADEQSEDEEEEEEEETEVRLKEPKIISTKGCGLFTKLSLRNSLSLLGPLSGLKVNSPKSASSPHSQSLTKTVKKAWDNYKKKSETVVEEPKRVSFSGELKGRLSPFRSSRSRSGELGMVQNGESKRFTYSGELYRGRLSPFRNTISGPISNNTRRVTQSGELHRNPRAASVSPFQRGAFLGVPKADYSDTAASRNRQASVDVKCLNALEILEQELAMCEDANPRQPPLPRSPSESWLWRTVPSSKTRHCPDMKGSSRTNTKWETIVKTTKLRNDHARYSEELVAHVSNQS